MKLHEIAHGRTGDKGTTSNISVIAYHAKDWPLIEAHVTAERVAAIFDRHVTVTRYVLPKLHALNFVVEGALEGGVTRSVALDAHGKSLGFAVLEMELPA
ncbi:hypothetical protein [Jiella avicenniae]|uniref:AtuA-like ferredoxin-fold domain-containing protein n=1 Tax=Jiella avicenniae TaxID=2907202 RepID=A0A9X1P1G2_9HYPH|nr:hypothetical protein [Jiella avicenniae]MCE7029647.1 hypothetical protein [Jiella avicenniae]